MESYLRHRANTPVPPEFFGSASGVTAANLNAWLASNHLKVASPDRTYSFDSVLSIPDNTVIEGTLNLIWTGVGSVPILEVGDNCEVENIVISIPTTTGNSATIGTGYKGKSFKVTGSGNSGAGFLTIADTEGLDLDLFESTGGLQRPLTLGNDASWSTGGRIGLVRVRDYTRGIGMNYLDGFILEGYDIQGRNALASFTAGHNGIIAAGLRNCRFGPGIIANAGEHLFRLGGTAAMGASYNCTFADMTLENPGGSYIKINADAIAYGFRFADINAVGSFASVPGGNREFLRLSHLRDFTFGACRLVVGEGFSYSAQDALALNDVDGVTIQSMHVEGLGQSAVDFASGQDIGDGLGNGDVRNITIGSLTGTDLTNRTMVRFSMAAGFEAGALNISNVDYFSDGAFFSASGTTVVDTPCSISGRFRKTDLETLPATTNLPENMSIDLMIGQKQVANVDGVLAEIPAIYPDPQTALPNRPIAAAMVSDNDRPLLAYDLKGQVLAATPTGIVPLRPSDASNFWQGDGTPKYFYTSGLRLPQDIARRAMIIPGYGQSLAGAANDNPTDTLTNAVATYPNEAFMPSVGPAPDGTFFDRVRPLVDIAGTGFNTRRAHWLSPMANGIIATMDAAFAVRPKIFTFSASEGGRTYLDLMPGNPAFDYLARGIQGCCMAARSMGLIPWVPAIFWVQGEQNRVDGLTEERIRRDLQNMAREVTALVRGMTGQSDDPVIFISQPNNSTSDNGVILPHMQAPVSMDGVENFRVLPPHYNLGMSSDGVANTGVHPDSAGYQVMGARFADVFVEEIFGRGYTAIKCTRAFWEDSSTIRLHYQTRGGDLVIDTSGAVVVVPTWSGSLNGWQFYDGSVSPPTIASMTVVDDPDTQGTRLSVLRIVLSAPSTGPAPRLHYATRNDGTGANSGRLTGPRGCLRDGVKTTFWANSQIIHLGRP